MEAAETKKEPSVFEAARHLKGRKTLIPSLKIFSVLAASGVEKKVKDQGEEKKLFAGRGKKSNSKTQS